MIKVRPAGERGKTRTDWLDSSHTFSFNRYYDPRYTRFRDLLVINEDFVAHAQGFGMQWNVRIYARSRAPLPWALI